MANRLGLAVIPGVGWRASEIQAVAREAEETGFDAIFAAEVNNDVMATAQLMGTATRRLQVGTWIANIYLRHSYACAQGAALIADATDGRFVLGLGVSHPPVNAALGIDMGDTSIALRRYVTAVRGWLKGEGPPTHLPQRPSVQRVPLYVAAVTSRTVEVASELADGIMPFLWSGAREAEPVMDRAGPREGDGPGQGRREPRPPHLHRRRPGRHAGSGARQPRPLHHVPLLPAALPSERLRDGSGPDGEERG